MKFQVQKRKGCVYMKGTLYGIGVGPGDPRLMTYLAVDTIKRCPVIAVPADGKGKAVAYKIASGIVEDLDAKECLNLSTPMTKDKAILDAAYQTAADTIIEQPEQMGRNVLSDMSTYHHSHLQCNRSFLVPVTLLLD